MLGNDVEMSLIFRRILGPLVLGWAPNHFVLVAQLAPGKKMLVCIPEHHCQTLQKPCETKVRILYTSMESVINQRYRTT